MAARWRPSSEPGTRRRRSSSKTAGSCAKRHYGSVIAMIVAGAFPSSRLFTNRNAVICLSWAMRIMSRSDARTSGFGIFHLGVGREKLHRLLVTAALAQERAAHDEIRRERIRHRHLVAQLRHARPRVEDVRHLVAAQALEIIAAPENRDCGSRRRSGTRAAAWPETDPVAPEIRWCRRTSSWKTIRTRRSAARSGRDTARAAAGRIP